ncbi:hypothetical protein MPSEU_000765600 [Mayamaea pseudoterrestris]|nr:hypothetical protein MPSEU_000765600 [Mayamaea pseudoterrestris]
MNLIETLKIFLVGIAGVQATQDWTQSILAASGSAKEHGLGSFFRQSKVKKNAGFAFSLPHIMSMVQFNASKEEVVIQVQPGTTRTTTTTGPFADADQTTMNPLTLLRIVDEEATNPVEAGNGASYAVSDDVGTTKLLEAGNAAISFPTATAAVLVTAADAAASSSTIVPDDTMTMDTAATDASKDQVLDSPAAPPSLVLGKRKPMWGIGVKFNVAFGLALHMKTEQDVQ